MSKKRVKAGTSVANAEAMRRQFVEAYLTNGGNATQAAITAGYSAKSARRIGTRLSTDVHIKAEIETRRAIELAQAQAKTGVTIEETLRELRGLVHSDLRKCFDAKTGALLPPHLWPDEVARAVSKVKVVEMAGGMQVDMGNGTMQHVPMYTKEVALWDKNAAIEKAMKHLGLFEEDNKQKPVAGVNVAVLTVRPDALHFEKVRARALGRA